MDGDEQKEDSWAARDLTSGLAKVYGAAKFRVQLAARVAGAWGAVTLLCGALNFVGLASTGPSSWEAAAGLSAVLLSVIAASLSPWPPVLTAVLVILDLVVVSARIPFLFESESFSGLVIGAIRIVAAPFVMYAMVLGYMGAADMRSFREGFRERDEWRASISPMTLQLIILAVFGIATLSGFALFQNAVVSRVTKGGITARSGGEQLPGTAGGDASAGKNAGNGGATTADGNRKGAAGPPGVAAPEASIPILSAEGFEGPSLRAFRDGVAFGAKHDETGCLIEGLHRQDRCRDKWCKDFVRVFLRSCLPKSSPSVGFCKDVPAPTAVEEGASWAATVCAGRVAPICRELYFAVQGHCHRPDAEAAK